MYPPAPSTTSRSPDLNPICPSVTIAIAETAGVTRLTVYRHFPDTNSLFDACTAHWAAQQQLPDPDAWLLVHEPRDRLHTGLSDLYRFFADAASMLTRTTRDWDEIPDFVRERTAQRDRLSAETLLSALAQAPTDRDPRASDQACCHHQHLALPVPGPGHVQPGRRRRHMVKLIC